MKSLYADITLRNLTIISPAQSVGVSTADRRENRTEQNRTEQNRTEQNRTEQNRTEQNRTELF
eukprot:SAG22_NODE_987_length_6142_cov_3.152242_2_plen_63_part_00